MTSNERKILECIWSEGGEAHVHLISSKTGFSSDYSQFLCRALRKSGYLEFLSYNICRLSKIGRKYFQGSDDTIITTAVASLIPTLTEESVDDIALSTSLSNILPNEGKDDEFTGDENAGEAKEDREAESDEKPGEDIEKRQEEVFSNEDEKIDPDPPADGGGAIPEIDENPKNDIKHDEKGVGSQTDNLIAKIGLIIRGFSRLLKESIKIPGSGNTAHETKRHR